MTKTLAVWSRQIARDAEVAATKGAGVVTSLVGYALAYAKLNDRSLSSGLDHALGALDGLPTVTAGFLSKASSFARAVVSHGMVDGAPLKAFKLASLEEADVIAEAKAVMAKVSIKAAVEARVAANADKKKSNAPKSGPVTSVTPDTPPVEGNAPAVDPAMARVTAATAALRAMMEAGDWEELAKITATLTASLAHNTAIKKAA